MQNAKDQKNSNNESCSNAHDEETKVDAGRVLKKSFMVSDLISWQALLTFGLFLLGSLIAGVILNWITHPNMVWVWVIGIICLELVAAKWTVDYLKQRKKNSAEDTHLPPPSEGIPLPPFQFSVRAMQSWDSALRISESGGMIANALSPLRLVEDMPPDHIFKRIAWPISALSYVYLVNTSKDAAFTIYSFSIEAVYGDGKTVFAQLPSGQKGYFTISMYRDRYERGKKLERDDAILAPILSGSKNAVTIRAGFTPDVFNKVIRDKTMRPGDTVQGWIFYTLPDGPIPIKYRMRITDTAGNTAEGTIEPIVKNYDGTQSYPNKQTILLADEVDMQGTANIQNQPGDVGKLP